MNRFFKSNKQLTPEIESVIVGTKESQRQRSKLGNIIVKLPVGDKTNYKCLDGWEELKQEDLETEFKKDEWQVDITQAAKDFNKK